MHSKAEKTPRQSRHLDLIAQFTSDIRYVKGEENVVADLLSRPSMDAVETKFSIKDLSEAQKTDQELLTLCSNTSKSAKFSLKQVHIPIENVQLWCEVSTSVNRPYIPSSFRKHIFESVHNLAHPSIRGTRKLIAKKYFWPKINQDINNWARCCLSCQKSKINKHTKSPLGKF